MGAIKNFFTKPRTKLGAGPLNSYVPGELFDPGAERFAYEPTTTTTPDFITRVYPQWNFTPLKVTQPEMNIQYLSLIPDGPQGFPYGGFQPTGLIDPSDYPDISGTFYE
jgi:hypothetical protein